MDLLILLAWLRLDRDLVCLINDLWFVILNRNVRVASQVVFRFTQTADFIIVGLAHDANRSFDLRSILFDYILGFVLFSFHFIENLVDLRKGRWVCVIRFIFFAFFHFLDHLKSI